MSIGISKAKFLLFLMISRDFVLFPFSWIETSSEGLLQLGQQNLEQRLDSP
jgi:hypothetical protein